MTAVIYVEEPIAFNNDEAPSTPGSLADAS